MPSIRYRSLILSVLVVAGIVGSGTADRPRRGPAGGGRGRERVHDR